MKKIFLLAAGALCLTSAPSKAVADSKIVGLSERKRSIVEVASLAAKGDLQKLETAIGNALDKGLTVNDLGEIFLQLYAYAGFPKSLNAQTALQKVVGERADSGKSVIYGTTPDAVPTENRYALGRETINKIFGQTASQDRPAATGYAETTDIFLKEHLFADIINRNNMSAEERELATFSMLAGIGNVNPQLEAHTRGALQSGNTPEELRYSARAIRQSVGKAEGKNAAAVLDAVLRSKNSADSSAGAASAIAASYPAEARVSAFPVGEPNDAFANYFSGQSYLAPLTRPGESAVFIANVTFEPGCRNNWHIHHASEGGGQILICVGGRGWYQEEGKEALALRPGDTVVIPAGVKHWHGAARDAWFAHLAVEVPGTDAGTEWLEPTSADAYDKLK